MKRLYFSSSYCIAWYFIEKGRNDFYLFFILIDIGRNGNYTAV